jgi:hypothetical protein
MANEYKGMRWLKCDLQMQTPADSRHWRGEKLVQGREEEAARDYAEACYKAGLDVVAITDHNFLSKDFIPHLQRAFKDIRKQYGHTITLFPGFEFEVAGVGRGVHVLCIFDPKSDLSDVDHILTICGVPPRRIDKDGVLAKSQLNLIEILKIVQKDNQGVVILPHSMGHDGLFDKKKVSDWLQADQFTNPDLLAIEIDRPVHEFNENIQKALLMKEDCTPAYRRIRPIATVMSSDNKMLLQSENGRPVPNSIGYRYSWIKMSEPTIESLRQAFLDHDSRIKLPNDVSVDVCPDLRQKHARINSIRIRNVAYLKDTSLDFSHNFNCIIGARGSGKSTILEYLRIVFGKDRNDSFDDGTERRIARIKKTLLSESSEIEVEWLNENGLKDQLIWKNGKVSAKNREIQHIGLFLDSIPIRFFSQQELNQLTETNSTSSETGQAQRLL